MITTILDREQCKTCKICCKYNDDDVWDAPGFTNAELKEALAVVSGSVYEKHSLFFYQLEKKDDEYVCPLLGEKGCLLQSKKPFKCAIWPLYVVHYNNRLGLAVSCECPNVYNLSNKEIVDRLGGVVAQITKIVETSPELVESFKDHFRFIEYLD